MAKRSKGHVLVHCAMGTNRSAAICLTYIMVDSKINLIQATQLMKDKRGKLLSNRGFQMQLVKFAKERKLLPKLH
jgi:protein-tyrosine phosphatase